MTKCVYPNTHSQTHTPHILDTDKWKEIVRWLKLRSGGYEMGGWENYFTDTIWDQYKIKLYRKCTSYKHVKVQVSISVTNTKPGWITVNQKQSLL